MMAAAAASPRVLCSPRLGTTDWLAGWLGSRGSLTRSLAWSLHSATHKQSYVIAIRHLPPPPLFSWFYLPHLSCWPLSCSFVLGSHSSVLILLRVQSLVTECVQGATTMTQNGVNIHSKKESCLAMFTIHLNISSAHGKSPFHAFL